MPTATTNYGLLKPLVNNPADEDLWGDELNDDMDDIDTLLRQGITVASQSSQTSSFTASATISIKYLYPCDATGGAIVATIPTAASTGNGATVFIKKTDSTSNAVTLTRSSSDTLDGATTLPITTQNGTYGLVSDGVSAWRSICTPAPVIPDASTIIKGIVELATAAETLTGTDADRALTAAGLAGNKSLAASGYYKFPGGLVLQWGTASTTSGSGTITYSTAFSTACYAVFPIPGPYAAASSTFTMLIGTPGLTTCAIFNQGGVSLNCYYFAIGK